MSLFALRRLLQMLPLLFGISVICFAVIYMTPGDPISIQTDLNPKISLEAKEKIKELYGLNDPLWMQYAKWMKHVVRLDFGYSFRDGQPVLQKIGRRIPITLLINGLSLFLILLLAIPLGVWGAVRAGTWVDRGITLFVYIGFAIPAFWFALLLMSFFGVRLHWLPVSGLTSLEFEFMSMWEKCRDIAHHLVLPVLVSGITSLAAITRFMRSSMLEVLHQDFIRTAYAKGLHPHVVFYKHAFRNALLPLVTLLGLSVPTLLGGSVIFETVFSIPGMGRLFFSAVMSRDYPVVMGLLMIGAVMTLLGNFIADMAYAKADPRIRLSRAERS